MKITHAVAILTLILAAPGFAETAFKPDEKSCPLHAQHMAEQAAARLPAGEIDRRGDEVMGFDHGRTTHHFLKTETGGLIVVEANDAADAASVDSIRVHLREIAQRFGQGDFAQPLAIHGRVLPGIETMTRLVGQIEFRYEELAKGGQVLISTENAEAQAAIKAFLADQIVDHRTHDPS